jgi:hypothetical protein
MLRGNIDPAAVVVATNAASTGPTTTTAAAAGGSRTMVCTGFPTLVLALVDSSCLLDMAAF